MSSTFNPEQFLGTDHTDAHETEYFPIPVGEYHAQITKVDIRHGVSERTGEPWHMLDLRWEILNDEVKSITALDHPTARQSLFLNVNPQGGLEFGRNKNVGLAKLRDSLGQNRAGRPWNFNMLNGQTAVVKVIHEQDQEGNPRAIVTKVTAA